jgi:hypothetical protein
MSTLAAIDLVLALITRAQQISLLVAQAQAEGRELSKADWDEIIAENDLAKSALEAAIAKAKAEGR